MKFRFRHLAAATTGLTFVLILLGVYTAAVGAGLTCGARWPLCDGAVFGLFPADWLSFVEWFHRFVAMITGFCILGTVYAAWKRRDVDRRPLLASAIALVVLPVQVVLGGATVTFYTELVQVAHHAAALVIFAALIATTLWAYESPARPEATTDHAARARPAPTTEGDD